MKVPRGAQFTAAAVLVSYIIGENYERLHRPPCRPPGALNSSRRWRPSGKHSMPGEYPFTGTSRKLPGHDDRRFLAGIDLILAESQRHRRSASDIR